MKEIVALFIKDIGWKRKGERQDFLRAEERTVNGMDVIILFHELESEESYVFMNHVIMIKFKEVK